MAPATPAQKRATLKHRAARRRIELLLEPDSPEAKALDVLVAKYGSVSAAVRAALLAAGHWEATPKAEKITVRAVIAPSPEPAKPALDVQLGPAPTKPGARLKGR